MPFINSTKDQARNATLSLCHFVTLSLLFILISCSHQGVGPGTKTAGTEGITGEANVLQVWHGDFPVTEIHRLPEKAGQQGIGYIAGQGAFENVWEVFKPGEAVPGVDFQSNLVLFVRNTQYFNRISIAKVMLKQGVAEVIAMETLSARPIEDKVAMSMALVARRGITGIQAREGVIRVQ